VEVVASLSQGRTAAAQCGLFTQKSVPVIFEPLCIYIYIPDLTLYLLRDFIQREVSQERKYRVTAELTILRHRQFYRTSCVNNNPISQ